MNGGIVPPWQPAASHRNLSDLGLLKDVAIAARTVTKMAVSAGVPVGLNNAPSGKSQGEMDTGFQSLSYGEDIDILGEYNFCGDVRRYNFVVFEQVAPPLNLFSFRSYMIQHLVDDGAVDPLPLIQKFEGHV